MLFALEFPFSFFRSADVTDANRSIDIIRQISIKIAYKAFSRVVGVERWRFVADDKWRAELNAMPSSICVIWELVWQSQREKKRGAIKPLIQCNAMFSQKSFSAWKRRFLSLSIYCKFTGRRRQQSSAQHNSQLNKQIAHLPSIASINIRFARYIGTAHRWQHIFHVRPAPPARRGLQNARKSHIRHTECIESVFRLFGLASHRLCRRGRYVRARINWLKFGSCCCCCVGIYYLLVVIALHCTQYTCEQLLTWQTTVHILLFMFGIIILFVVADTVPSRAGVVPHVCGCLAMI